MNSSALNAFVVSIPSIHRCDRWQLCQRLQDLQIPAQCTSDGQLKVEIQYPVDIIQLQSVTQQLLASRSQLILGLEQCWQLPSLSHPRGSL